MTRRFISLLIGRRAQSWTLLLIGTPVVSSLAACCSRGLTSCFWPQSKVGQYADFQLLCSRNLHHWLHWLANEAPIAVATGSTSAHGRAICQSNQDVTSWLWSERAVTRLPASVSTELFSLDPFGFSRKTCSEMYICTLQSHKLSLVIKKKIGQKSDAYWCTFFGPY